MSLPKIGVMAPLIQVGRCWRCSHRFARRNVFDQFAVSHLGIGFQGDLRIFRIFEESSHLHSILTEQHSKNAVGVSIVNTNGCNNVNKIAM